MSEGSRFTFGEQERVRGKKRIDALFSQGRSFISYPFRVSYHLFPCSAEVSASLLVSIPKKRFKKAVDRNRLKRLTREAYRLNKKLLQTDLLPDGYCIDIGFIYVNNEPASYDDVQQAVCKALKKINRELDTKRVLK